KKVPSTGLKKGCGCLLSSVFSPVHRAFFWRPVLQGRTDRARESLATLFPDPCLGRYGRLPASPPARYDAPAPGKESPVRPVLPPLAIVCVAFAPAPCPKKVKPTLAPPMDGAWVGRAWSVRIAANRLAITNNQTDVTVTYALQVDRTARPPSYDLFDVN